MDIKTARTLWKPTTPGLIAFVVAVTAPALETVSTAGRWVEGPELIHGLAHRGGGTKLLRHLLAECVKGVHRMIRFASELSRDSASFGSPQRDRHAGLTCEVHHPSTHPEAMSWRSYPK